MTTPSPGLVIRRMSFAEYGGRSPSRGRQVVMEQRGCGEDFIGTPCDEEGLPRPSASRNAGRAAARTATSGRLWPSPARRRGASR